MGNEAGLIILIAVGILILVAEEFPSPMGNEVGLIDPEEREMLSRELVSVPYGE